MSDALAFEARFWGSCCNTFDEERKHFVYARLMGLKRDWFSFDVAGARIIDIGGGPASMLLKATNFKYGLVCDPLVFPPWVYGRYREAGVTFALTPGEEIGSHGFDEAWIYNCLQHTVDPERVVANARRAARIVRLFEWIDIPAYEGHPHMLTSAGLSKWLGGPGAVIDLAEDGCHGRSFSGVFEGV